MNYAKDMTGQRFGALTAVSRAPHDPRFKSRAARWLCACDCGAAVIVPRGNLVKGGSQSCGCATVKLTRLLGTTKREKSADLRARAKSDRILRDHPTLQDLTGRRFGRLVVRSRGERGQNNSRRWNCECDCGAKTLARTTNLLNGGSRSCGCLRDRSPLGSNRDRYPVEYNVWKHRKGWQRNTKPAPEWEDFERFLADIPAKPTPGSAFRKIDPYGGFTPENTRWFLPGEKFNTKAKRKKG